MTMLEAVAFPATLDELAGMGSAELRVLVGKLPNAEVLHPKLASMGYHMSKAQRIDFIGFHYYGVGTAESAAAALTAAEGKYAIHQSKKGNKTGKVKAPGGVATNCSATAGKALAELAQHVPIDTKTAAHLNDWAKLVTGSPGKDDLTKLLKVVSEASAADDAVGPALSNLFDLGDAMGDWINVKEATNSKQAWEAAQSLTENAKKVYGQAPDLSVLAAQDAAQAASDAVVTAAGEVLEALPGLGSSVGIEAIDTLQKAVALDFSTLPFPTMKGTAKQLTNAVDVLDTLADAAKKVDIPHPLTDQFLATPNLADDIQKKMVAYLDTLTGDQQAELAEAWPFSAVQKLKAVSDTAASAAQAAADDLLAEAVQSAVSTGKDAYLALSKAELKKIGPTKFAEHGIEPKSLAHYLTKDELAEALAKIDNTQPVDDLVEIAKAKKVAHKTGASAAQKADPAPTAPSTVLEPEQLAKKKAATEAANPKTVAAIEDSPAPEFTPAPESLNLPAPKHAKPAQTKHAWSPKQKQANLGGAHTKHQYVDEDGNVWMWKKAETKGVADGEVLAHDIGWDLGFDMADIRYADGWQVPGKGRFAHGTVQKFHDGVKADMTTVKVGDFTAEQVGELQEHQVFDWLISQHDTHSENILVMADGHLVPIDKGQAFKFFGADKLEVGYSPKGNFGKPVYYDLWDEYAAGRIGLDLDAIDNVLARIESIPDAEYRAKVTDYVKQRFADGSGVQFLPAKLRTPDALIDAIMERKANIRSEFTEFYKAQAKRRGVKWNPIWEQRLAGAPAEVVEELGEAAVTSGFTSPITKTLAADVDRMGTGGKAIKLAGKDIHQGQALVYTEKAADGSKILRLELRLEHEADDRLTETLKGITGELGTGNAQATGGIGYVPDPEWSTVEKFAKTVGAHASDGQYNMGTVNEAHALMEQIDGKILAANKKATVAKGAGDFDTWALNKAQAEKLGEYKKHLEAIDTAYNEGVAPPYKASAVDITKSIEGWKAKAPTAAPQVTEEATEDIFDKLTIGDDRFAAMERDQDFLGWRRSGQERPVHTNQFGAQKVGQSVSGVGKQFDGIVDVDGTKVGVHFRSYQQTGAMNRKGLLDVEILEWDGSPDGIEKAMAAVRKMGVDLKLATAEDEALTYWRVLTGTFKNSKEYVQGTGSGPYGKVRKTIDAIESKVAQAGDLTPQQEIAIYRDAWTDTFGADAVARAPERLVPQRNIYGDEMGYGYVHRFDLPEDLSGNFGTGAGGWVHGTTHLTGSDVTSLPGGATLNDLIRHGAHGEKSTTSGASDLYSGGGEGVFAKRGWGNHYTSNNEIILARPATTDLRVGTYNFHSDQFGSMAQRDSLYSLDPAQSVSKTLGGGENVIRGSVSFGEDTEAIIYRSKAKQTEALSELHRLGVTEIRGRPVEERILFARSDADAKALITKLTKERKAELYRPYDDVRPAAVPEPKIPAKAKATKAPKAKAVAEPDVPLATDTPSAADPFAPGTPTPTKPLTKSAAGNLPVADEITPLTTATPGKKVAASVTDPTYSYKVPGIGKKVDVQFSSFAGDKYVMAQLPETGDWFLLTKVPNGTKVGKDQVLQGLVDIGWPKAKLA